MSAPLSDMMPTEAECPTCEHPLFNHYDERGVGARCDHSVYHGGLCECPHYQGTTRIEVAMHEGLPSRIQ